LRFVLFGLGGLLLLTIFSFEFIAGVRPQPDTAIFISPLLALPIALVGALVMLFAVSGWGQWAYLWVILSIPITLLLVTTVLPGDKGLATGLAIAVTASASNVTVRFYYRRRTPN
jgi:peptidoglycan/LPS O-acetylase OafA/YrhL